MKYWDKPATELLKNDTCNSSIDESGCAAYENKQENVNDTNSWFFLSRCSWFCSNLKVSAKFHGHIASKSMNKRGQSKRDVCKYEKSNTREQKTIIDFYTKGVQQWCTCKYVKIHTYINL